jgi:hypothetical protein
MEETVHVVAAPMPPGLSDAHADRTADPAAAVAPGAAPVPAAVPEKQKQAAAARVTLKPFVAPPVRSEAREARLPEPPPVTAAQVETNALALLGSLAPPVLPTARSGRLIWSGTLARRGVLALVGSKPSSGSVSGSLPTSTAKLSVWPAESARDGLTVYVTDATRHNKTEAAGPSSGGKRLHYVWDPERVKQLKIAEAPNPDNQFGRLVVKNDGRTCAAIIVEWKVE